MSRVQTLRASECLQNRKIEKKFTNFVSGNLLEVIRRQIMDSKEESMEDKSPDTEQDKGKVSVFFSV